MKYKVTLNNRVYEVEVEEGKAMLIDEYESVAPISYASAPIMAAPAAAPAAPAAAPAAPAAEPEGNVVKSPMVGTFYSAPAPGNPPYVQVGSTVKAGDTLCIIEAMKLLNEVEAESAGTIKKILVENGTPVEFGQPLFIIG